MRILMLGNNQDRGQWFEGGKKRHEIVAERLESEFGEPVEFEIKPYWPSEQLPRLIERWIAESNPDMLYVNVTAFPFSYESLPLRAKRILGRLGPKAGDAGMRIADSKRWSHNWLFRKVRRYGQATIGGDTHFTPEEAIANTSGAIRAVVRHEGVYLAVEGPLGRGEPELTHRQRHRKEARRKQVHLALKHLCADLSLFYLGREDPLPLEKAYVPGTVVGDGMHGNAAWHAYMSDDLYDNLRQAWQARLALETPAV